MVRMRHLIITQDDSFPLNKLEHFSYVLARRVEQQAEANVDSYASLNPINLANATPIHYSSRREVKPFKLKCMSV